MRSARCNHLHALHMSAGEQLVSKHMHALLCSAPHPALRLRARRLSGSGKSTVACTLEHALHEMGHATALLDGDNVRHGLNK